MSDEVNYGGYESLVWIRDNKGKVYACPLEAIKGKVKDGDELTDEERARCTDVNTIVGTERW